MHMFLFCFSDSMMQVWRVGRRVKGGGGGMSSGV